MTIRNAKLTPTQVLEIREKYWQQHYTQGALCREYEVSVVTIGRIVRGESWKAQGGPGYHANATERPAEQNLRESAEDHAIMAGSAKPSEAEIQASLAKLSKLGIEAIPVEPKEED
jgi:hypothetical protein